MTPKEFKAWFDGFSEGISGIPTDTQWTRIKARVAEIDGNPVSYPYFVDRYLERRPYYERWPLYRGSNKINGDGSVWCSTTAMNELGKTEYSATITR